MDFNISKLGFGLSSIAGSGNFKRQQSLIRTAIDNGITHFDVAPYYGSGDAETILGKALVGCTEKVTITTKYGLMPAAVGGSFLRSIARPIFRHAKFLKKFVSSAVSSGHKSEMESFVKGSLIQSVDDSIRKIGRPIDIFLLHEVSAHIALDPIFIEELIQVSATGKINLKGISGSDVLLLNTLETGAKQYKVAQLENSLTIPAPINQLKEKVDKIITHRAIQGGLSALTFLMENRSGFKQNWEREIGADATDVSTLAQLLLEVALAENKNGTVLFSTTKPERIKEVSNAIAKPILKTASDVNMIRTLFDSVYVKEVI